MRNKWNYLHIDLTKRTSLIFIIIFTIIALVDSTIVKFLSYYEVQLPISSNVAIFILLSAVFGTSGIMLLIAAKKIISKSAYKYPIRLRYFHGIATGTQIITLGIILIIILQMIISNKYNVLLLHASTYVNHVSALVFMIFLIFMFLGWLKLRRNYIVTLYVISFSLVCVNLVVSVIYLESQFLSYQSSLDRKPYPINLYIITQNTGAFAELLHTVFDILYLLSFFSIWISTAVLLNQYPSKLTRIKYTILLSIPLVYYLFPFTEYFGNFFSSYVSTSPITFGVIYVLTFSATKQLGALLFSLAFLITSTLVAQGKLRSSLLVTGIGIVILFSSIEIVTLQYRLYPPFGLVTQSFISMGSYLLFVGVLSSAKDVSQDVKIREEVYKSAKNQLNLLKTIGMTQMENEFVKKYKSVAKRTNMSEDDNSADLEPEELRKIVRDTLKELSKSKEKYSEG